MTRNLICKMMKINKRFFKKLCFATITLTWAGCQNILEPDIQGQIPLETLLTTESGMLTAVNGMYEPLQTMYKGSFQRLTDLASDDGWTWRNELEPDLFIAEPVFTHSQNIWSTSYQGIARTNTVLDNLDNVTDFSSEQSRKNIEGQARFLRAAYYFNLVRLFGGVPLIVRQIGSRTDAELPRASIEEAYAQIKADLTEAYNLLPAAYGSGVGNEAGRPVNLSAAGLKTLVHLELGEWDEVIAAADLVIGKKTLQNDYASYFDGSAENNQGTLFEVQYGGVDLATTSSLSTFLAPTSTQNGGAIILPTDDNLNGRGGGPSSGNGIVQAFETGDLRKEVSLNSYNLPNFVDASKPAGSLFYIHKYYNTKDPNGRSTWNFPLIRYSEILLAKAEAMNEKAFQSGGVALDLLNQVRVKAGLPALLTAQVNTQESFRKALRNERRVEFAFETKRYFDLNRWGIMETTMQPQLDFLALKFPAQRTVLHPITGKKYYLYPIPATEFINNAKLGQQNPGYN